MKNREIGKHFLRENGEQFMVEQNLIKLIYQPKTCQEVIVQHLSTQKNLKHLKNTPTNRISVSQRKLGKNLVLLNQLFIII